MSLRNFPIFPALTDSIFSDRIDRIDRLFSQLTGDTPISSTPSYNLRQHDNENYSLALSVPGWKEHELEIEAAGGRLTITGQKKDPENNVENNVEENNKGWLHRGINRTNFRLCYNIPEHMKVTEAKLEDGLLYVKLYLEIPESEKPRRIPIKQHHKSDTIEHQK